MKKFNEDKLIKRDIWHIGGTGFSVEISHVFRPGFLDEGIEATHNWCLYVIIFSQHPLFNSACRNEVDYDTDLGDRLYNSFHQGCTYYNKQKDWVKIGCDYQHLGDKWFMQQKDLPSEIVADAKALFEYMEQKANA